MKRVVAKRIILILLLVLAFTPQITLISLVGFLSYSPPTAVLVTGLHILVSATALWVVFKHRSWFFGDRPRRKG